MKTTNVKSLLIAGAISLALMSFRTPLGGEFYRIALNGKQVVEQIVSKNTQTPSISLNMSGSDKLNVYYNHCGYIGTNRSLMLKSGQENIKTWSFINSIENMSINIKDIPFKKVSNNDLKLYYKSDELPGGRLLAKIQLKNQPSAKNN